MWNTISWISHTMELCHLKNIGYHRIVRDSHSLRFPGRAWRKGKESQLSFRLSRVQSAFCERYGFSESISYSVVNKKPRYRGRSCWYCASKEKYMILLNSCCASCFPRHILGARVCDDDFSSGSGELVYWQYELVCSTCGSKLTRNIHSSSALNVGFAALEENRTKWTKI